VNILPSQRPPGPCLPWCAGHLPNDDGVVHISREHIVPTIAPDGSEPAELYVSIEQVGDEPPAIRLEGAASTPMGLAQALHLTTVIQALVGVAATAQVTR
jgi:hypothetical protein